MVLVSPKVVISLKAFFLLIIRPQKLRDQVQKIIRFGLVAWKWSYYYFSIIDLAYAWFSLFLCQYLFVSSDDQSLGTNTKAKPLKNQTREKDQNVHKTNLHLFTCLLKIYKNEITKQAGVRNVLFDYVLGQRFSTWQKNIEDRAGMGQQLQDCTGLVLQQETCG